MKSKKLTRKVLWTRAEAAEAVGCSPEVFRRSVERCIRSHSLPEFDEPLFRKRDVVGRVGSCRFFGVDPFEAYQ